MIEHIGRMIIFVGLALGTFVWLLGLPAFSITGLWFQTEPVIATRLAICGLLVAALGVFERGRIKPRPNFLWHPLPGCFLLIAAWGAVGLPFVPYPGLSIFGSPELGEGVAGFAAFAVMTAAAIHVCRYPRYRLAIGVTATSSILLLTVFVLVGNSHYLPFYFNDFLGPSAAYLIILAVTWLRMKNPYHIAVVIVAAVGIALASENRGMFLSGAASFISFAYLRWLLRRRQSRIVRLTAAVAAIAAPLALVLGVVALGRSGLQDAIGFGAASSFFSRWLLIEVVLNSIAEQPLTAIWGAGWGHFTELLIGQVAFDSIGLHSFVDSTTWFWDSTWRADFHSHNQLVETLSGGGIPAACLWLAVLALLPLTAARRFIPLAGAFAIFIGIQSSIWFEMPTGTPLLALSFAGITVLRRPKSCVSLGFAHKTLMSIMAVGLFAASILSFIVAHQARLEANVNLGARAPETNSVCKPFFTDFGRSGRHLSWLMRSHINAVKLKLKNGEPVAEWEIKRIDRFFCQLDEHRAAGNSLRILSSLLIARADLAFVRVDEEFIERRAKWLQGWASNLDQFLERAPKRTDLAAPYFHWLLANGKEDELIERANSILNSRAADPVGLWFSGVAMMRTPEGAAAGFERLKEAVENGVERIFPIDPDIKRQLGFSEKPAG
jgi:hypothetical protein